MTSLHDDMIAAYAVPDHMEHLGRGTPISYLVPGSDPVTLKAIVGAESSEDVESDGDRTRRRVRTVKITTDPDGAYGGVATPVAARDTMIIDDETWALEAIELKEAGLVVLRVVRPEAAYKGGH